MADRSLVRSSLTVLIAALAIAGAAAPAHADASVEVFLDGPNQAVGPPQPPCPFVVICLPDEVVRTSAVESVERRVDGPNEAVGPPQPPCPFVVICLPDVIER